MITYDSYLWALFARECVISGTKITQFRVRARTYLRKIRTIFRPRADLSLTSSKKARRRKARGSKIGNHRRAEGGNSYSRYDVKLHYARCPAITPNLVVRFGPVSSALSSIEKHPRAQFTAPPTPSHVYKFLLFWLHNPHFYGGRWKDPQPVICDFSRGGPDPDATDECTRYICICRTLSLTVSYARVYLSPVVAFPEMCQFTQGWPDAMYIPRWILNSKCSRTR